MPVSPQLADRLNLGWWQIVESELVEFLATGNRAAPTILHARLQVAFHQSPVSPAFAL